MKHCIMRLLKTIRFLTIATLLLALSSGTALAAEKSFGFLPTKQFHGKTYQARPSSDITTVLLIGYDHKDEGDITVEQHGYSNGGQSDMLLLLVFDHEHEQIRQLQIDRDTMTPIKLIGSNGTYMGTRTLQICLSHAYGDTQEVNNANAVWAVERLLGIDDTNDGVGVDWYITMDISGINRLNELLGGVTVPIEDDFSKIDPTMVMGTTMRLTGPQAEYYCRYRYDVGDQTNKTRMARQRHYMLAASEILRSEFRKDRGYLNDLLDGMGIVFDTSPAAGSKFSFQTYTGTPVTDTPTHYLMTNNTVSGIVGLMVKSLDYEIMDVETLPGEHILGSKGLIEYRLDSDCALEWAINVFYE